MALQKSFLALVLSLVHCLLRSYRVARKSLNVGGENFVVASGALCKFLGELLLVCQILVSNTGVVQVVCRSRESGD